MPELGKYAAEVLAAYGVSLVLLAGLIWISIWRARRVASELDAAEARLRSEPASEEQATPVSAGGERT